MTSARDRFVARSEGPILSEVGPAERGALTKTKGREALREIKPRLAEWQERLTAEGQRSVLLVLQGMDTSGKDGTIKRVVGAMNPQGIHLVSFKRPTDRELAKHFLWRIKSHAPKPGTVAIFNRSHYEDVVTAFVQGTISADERRSRFDEIDKFEREIADRGTTIVKVFLHISKSEQAERLIARLEDPTKRWKFNEHDITQRERWDEYAEAYETAIRACSEIAPWYIVPADRKWHRDLVVAQILLETFEELSPDYPDRALDLDALKRRILDAG